MKQCIIFCLLLLNSLALFAKENVWYEGSVVLKTKEVLRGEILIEPKHDLILYRNNDEVEVYPSHRIHSVYFYDEDANINRRFISLKHSGLFNHHQLYEVVVCGEVNLFRKQKALTGNYPQDDEGFNYFISYRDQLVPLHKFRTSVYPHLLESAGSRLSTFMDENKLNPNLRANAVVILQFYNGLKKDDQLLAKH